MQLTLECINKTATVIRDPDGQTLFSIETEVACCQGITYSIYRSSSQTYGATPLATVKGSNIFIDGQRVRLNEWFHKHGVRTGYV